MLGLSSASYASGTGQGDIERVSGRRPLIWYAFDEILRLGVLPNDGSEFPDTDSTESLASKGTDVNPINANTGTPSTNLTAMKRQCVRFDGTDDVVIMNSVVTSTNKAGTMLLVFNKSDAANDIVVSEDDTSSSGRFYVKITGAGNANVVMNMGASHNVAKTFTLANRLAAGQDTMILIRRNTTGHVFIYTQNGLAAQNTGNADVLAMPTFDFKHIGGATTTDFTGAVGEFAFWDQEISDAGCLAIIDSIKEKWGLVNLP